MSLDLQLQDLRCPTLAVGGTNGKSTTCSLLERMLAHNHRRIVRCGPDALPVSSVPNRGADLDFMVLSVDPFELQYARCSFRPAVAVLLNLWPDHLDYYTEAENYVRAFTGLFSNQQYFDWAVIQSQALVHLRQAQVPVPTKVITFSATDNTAS